MAILVDGKMHGSKRPAADLLLHQILVDAVLGSAVVLAVAVLGPCIERFLAARVS